MWRIQWESVLYLFRTRQRTSVQTNENTNVMLFARDSSSWQNLGLTEGQLKDTQEIIETIEQYVDGHINEMVEWGNFRRRVQQQGKHSTIF